MADVQRLQDDTPRPAQVIKVRRTEGLDCSIKANRHILFQLDAASSGHPPSGATKALVRRHTDHVQRPSSTLSSEGPRSASPIRNDRALSLPATAHSCPTRFGADGTSSDDNDEDHGWNRSRSDSIEIRRTDGTFHSLSLRPRLSSSPNETSNGTGGFPWYKRK
ncbi:hypothetical protein JKP88DRAFT_264637 [Tribonema minus]|uniref:Uncharacterized protein n=1 Tax=Tribonema minus TaxID=303371 RepID=A0A836CBS5_9STRA|nr:hypothetical protein JKP88DRAFT_264637 [Tribonema minus]